MLKQLGELFLTTKGEGGTGIGLWVTKRIVQKHKGSLQAYSSQTPGRSGTVFALCFPPPHAYLKGNTMPKAERPKARSKSRSASPGKASDTRKTA